MRMQYEIRFLLKLLGESVIYLLQKSNEKLKFNFLDS